MSTEQWPTGFVGGVWKFFAHKTLECIQPRIVPRRAARRSIIAIVCDTTAESNAQRCTRGAQVDACQHGLG
jgi:hypothetical protein